MAKRAIVLNGFTKLMNHQMTCPSCEYKGTLIALIAHSQETGHGKKS